MDKRHLQSKLSEIDLKKRSVLSSLRTKEFLHEQAKFSLTFARKHRSLTGKERDLLGKINKTLAINAWKQRIATHHFQREEANVRMRHEKSEKKMKLLYVKMKDQEASIRRLQERIAACKSHKAFCR